MELSSRQKTFFTRSLMQWHSTLNYRDLPWKNEKDPYKIWLSEIILQQTRALQGLPYYIAFTTKYPTVADLANADENEAFRLWQGLGYYNRCKNMLATARYIVQELNGVFPTSYDQLLMLKGVGPYTAAAIASFAYGLPTAVVDGNVTRVLSRYFGIETPFDTTEGKQCFTTLAGQLLDTDNSGAYNQAIMDLGATVCTPKKADCDACPLQKNCFALRQNVIGVLPVRSKKIVVKNRYFNYLLLISGNKIWIGKRTKKDIWENLNEPLLIETDEAISEAELMQHPVFTHLNLDIKNITHSGKSTQRLTHQLIHSTFFTITLLKKPEMPSENGSWTDIGELKKVAFPKTVVSFLRNNLYF